jgi:hypothetical protein
MTELRARGVEDILIALIDGLTGFPSASAAVFPKTQGQTCIVRHNSSGAASPGRILNWLELEGTKQLHASPSLQYKISLERLPDQHEDELPVILSTAYLTRGDDELVRWARGPFHLYVQLLLAMATVEVVSTSIALH